MTAVARGNYDAILVRLPAKARFVDRRELTLRASQDHGIHIHSEKLGEIPGYRPHRRAYMPVTPFDAAFL